MDECQHFGSVYKQTHILVSWKEWPELSSLKLF